MKKSIAIFLSLLVASVFFMAGCNKKSNIPSDAPDFDTVISVLETSGYVQKLTDDPITSEGFDDTHDKYYIVCDESLISELYGEGSNEIISKVILAYYEGKEILNACYYKDESEAKKTFIDTARKYADMYIEGMVLVETPKGHGHIIYDGYASLGGSDDLIAIYGTEYYSGNAIVTVGSKYYDGFLDEVNNLIKAFGLEGPLEIVDSNLYK